jgi:hypothetical protein
MGSPITVFVLSAFSTSPRVVFTRFSTISKCPSFLYSIMGVQSELMINYGMIRRDFAVIQALSVLRGFRCFRLGTPISSRPGRYAIRVKEHEKPCGMSFVCLKMPTLERLVKGNLRSGHE